MRVVKEAEERRNEILDVADELFRKKGFDGTSTNDILDIVGIARGTLYYHFKSKLEILDALVERYSERLLKNAQLIATEKEIPVNERLVRVIKSLNISGGSGNKIIEQLHKPQNALMHQKMQRAMLTGVTPILAVIIEEGITEGIYETAYPYECMEMAMAYGSVVLDDGMIEQKPDERMTRIQAFIYNLERLLGVANGTLAKDVLRIFYDSKDEQE